MKEKILLAANELFIKYGVKCVTMDDIAKELSISKKTIYQYYKDKNEIVKDFTLKQCESRREDFSRIPGESKNSIEALLMTSRCIRENIVELNPSLLMDIQKYYTDAWETFEDFKKNFFYKSIQDTINRGIEEGYFRKDINPEILSIMRMQQVQDCFDSRIYARDKFNFKEVQMQLLDHFMHGLLTIEGQEIFNQYLNNSQKG